MTFSKVKVRAIKDEIQIRVYDDPKFHIPEEMIEKWQSMLNLIAEIYDVPSVLIMRVHEESIEVFKKNNNPGNPYEENEMANLGNGLYCETVMGLDKALEVSNALETDLWKNNPDVELNMTYYYGLPLKLPQGEHFGTICILDHKSHFYTDTYVSLFNEFKQTIEKDLALSLNYIELQNSQKRQERLQELIVEHDRNRTIQQYYLNLTHEINTPIGVARATSTYVQNMVLDFKKKQAFSDDETIQSLENIHEASSLMVVNIDRLSEIIMSSKSFLETTEKKEYSSIDFTEYLHSVMLSMKFELKRKHITYSIESDLEKYVYTYPNWIAQIVQSLVSNSIQHGFINKDDGLIRIDLKELPEKIELSYSDNGIGIRDADVFNIFKPLYKLSENEENYGTGLTITRYIVEEKLSGEIRIDREYKHGLRFIMLLPKV